MVSKRAKSLDLNDLDRRVPCPYKNSQAIERMRGWENWRLRGWEDERIERIEGMRWFRRYCQIFGIVKKTKGHATALARNDRWRIGGLLDHLFRCHGRFWESLNPSKAVFTVSREPGLHHIFALCWGNKTRLKRSRKKDDLVLIFEAFDRPEVRSRIGATRFTRRARVRE